MTSSAIEFDDILSSGQPSDVVALALRGAPLNRKAPNRDDPRFEGGLVFPGISPSFQLQPGARVFTIGSCFAREIESNLHGFDLPVRQLEFGPDEVDGHPASMLNEYNTGSIAQRIGWALDGVDTAALTDSVWGEENAAYDLLLSKGFTAPVGDLMDRRRRIDATYAQMKSCDLVIITLGLSEVWYDRELKLFLNRIPSWLQIRTNPARYTLLTLTPDQNFALLDSALKKLLDAGLKNVVLTVSPVPMGSTFRPKDAMVANTTSKASLQIAATRLADKYEGRVDYFPSYEIVTSAGGSAFQDDLIHVRPEVVAKIMAYFSKSYVASHAEAQSA